MRAGTLRDQVTLEAPAAPSESAWGVTPQHQAVATVWASVVATDADESDGSVATRTLTRYAVRIRYRSDVTSKWRIGYRGRTLDITSVVDPDGRRRELLIEAVRHG